MSKQRNNSYKFVIIVQESCKTIALETRVDFKMMAFNTFFTTQVIAGRNIAILDERIGRVSWMTIYNNPPTTLVDFKIPGRACMATKKKIHQ